MIRILSVVLLWSLLAGLALAAPAPDVSCAPASGVNQAAGDGSDGMSFSGCAAVCSAAGACIPSTSKQLAALRSAELLFMAPPPQLAGRACAPDTAPPKRFCA